jgi:hypothetical protein
MYMPPPKSADAQNSALRQHLAAIGVDCIGTTVTRQPMRYWCALSPAVKHNISFLAAKMPVAERRLVMQKGSSSRFNSGAEARTRSPVFRQSSWMRAAVFTVSPRRTISFLTEPISLVTTGPQFGLPRGVLTGVVITSALFFLEQVWARSAMAQLRGLPFLPHLALKTVLYLLIVLVGRAGAGAE